MGRLVCEQSLPGGRQIALHQGDLTKESVDAIVNAANSHLAHGGGVAGAIVRAGGTEIQDESDRIVQERGPIPAGGAAVTGAGRLPCKAVIHAVGPRWGEGKEDDKLRRAIQTSLDLADERRFVSIAFPAISSGIFGFPKHRCARIFWKTCADWLATHPGSALSEIRFTLIDDPTVAEFKKAFEEGAGSSSAWRKGGQQ